MSALTLPSKCRRYLEARAFTFEEIRDGAQNGVIIRSFYLPKGKYDVDSADLLILLPDGYPDMPPDMFYLHPWIKLRACGAYANATNVPHDFGGQSWQRWSRHNNEWRRGTDGIQTMIKRAELALEEAKQ